MLLPRYWQDARFGGMRPSAPVVGVSWYEANAYCKWLRAHWAEMEEGRGQPKPAVVRLPTRAEWVLAAGGDELKERFPWDPPGMAEATGKEKEATIAEVVRRANVSENKISRTTPVWMYPQGASLPHGVLDMGGNVWEWHANYRDSIHDGLSLSGGSWYYDWSFARVSARRYYKLDLRGLNFGFRVCFLPSFVS